MSQNNKMFFYAICYCTNSINDFKDFKQNKMVTCMLMNFKKKARTIHSDISDERLSCIKAPNLSSEIIPHNIRDIWVYTFNGRMRE